MVSEIFLEKVIKHELTLRCLTFQLLRKIFRCLCRSLRASGVPVTRTKIWTPQLQFDRKQQKNFDKLLISWEDHIGTAYSSLAAFKLRGLSTLLRKLAAKLTASRRMMEHQGESTYSVPIGTKITVWVHMVLFLIVLIVWIY